MKTQQKKKPGKKISQHKYKLCPPPPPKMWMPLIDAEAPPQTGHCRYTTVDNFFFQFTITRITMISNTLLIGTIWGE